MKVKINWEHKRAKHALERMWLRGISQEDIVHALQRGQKTKQKTTGLMEALHGYFSVVYDEYIYADQGLRKIYPVTVKLW